MSAHPQDPIEALGQAQRDEIDPQAPDPREPFSEVAADQQQEIDPDLPDPR